VVAVVLVAVLVTLTGLVSFLLFHTVAEVMFAVVGFGVLIMAATLRQFLDDDFPVFVGIALATAALLQLVHTVDFPGMNVISGTPDTSAQMWVAARIILAVSFVVAPFVLGRRLSMRFVASLYVALALLTLASVYWWDVFPTAYVPGSGPTRFKMLSEYLVSALFVLAIVLLWRRRSLLPGQSFQLLMGALVASTVAELWLSIHTGPQAWPNMIGLVFLVLSAILVYLGVVEDGLARPHAAAVANLREAQRLHERLEKSLLPTVPVRHPAVDVVTYYRPGQHELELGGDFIDVVDEHDGGLAVICGDVSGHGPDAAALATMLRVSWEALVLSGTPPPALVGALHDVLVRERVNADTFATLCLAWVQPASDTIELLTLGHPLPLVVADGVRQLEAMPEPPLGVLDAPGGVPVRLQLPDGWRLLFYTDGLIEGHAAPGAHERFGEERLIAALERLSGLDRESIAELVETIERLGGEPFADDVTVAVIGKR